MDQQRFADLYPGYPVSSIPVLPAGFEWDLNPGHLIPTASDKARGVHLTVDHPEAGERGDPNAPRFVLRQPDEGGHDDDILAYTDDLQEVEEELKDITRWTVGERVMLWNKLDVFNYPKLPACSSGTVVRIDESAGSTVIDLLLDRTVSALADWHNILQITEDGEITRSLFTSFERDSGLSPGDREVLIRQSDDYSLALALSCNDTNPRSAQATLTAAQAAWRTNLETFRRQQGFSLLTPLVDPVTVPETTT